MAMASYWAAIRHWSARVLIRYLGVYLIYLSTLVRLVTIYDGRPERGLVALLLAAYGLLLVMGPWVTRRQGWRRWAYLLLQSGLVISLQRIPPGLELISALFVPLALQAALFFSPRTGFAWITAFTLAIAGPVMAEWDWALPGLAMVLLYVAAFFLMGHFAYLIRRAEAARRENQRLIDDLQVAHRQLQDYAAQMEEFAAAQERSRLARELHDSATQTIFSMNLTVETAHMLLPREPGRVAEQLDRLQELTQRAVGEIQVLVNQLRPRTVSAEGLPAALQRLVAEREARDGLRIRLEMAGEKELPEPVVAGLCRIVQEALNNVVKHARTREVAVRLNLAGAKACLEVEDHGVGFDPGAVARKSGHLGLWGMAERARELGWDLTYDARPGRGTRIRAEEM